MGRMLKSTPVAIACGFFACYGAAAQSAQQMTRFAVVDTNRVYQAYFRDTGPTRNYETKKAEFQKEIDRLTENLKKLQNQKLEYENGGNQAEELRIDAEIARQTQYVSDYASAKNIELETMRKNLQSSDAFYNRLYMVLARIAESEGYSAILSLQQMNGILWYSPTVDITDSVIRSLGL